MRDEIRVAGTKADPVAADDDFRRGLGGGGRAVLVNFPLAFQNADFLVQLLDLLLQLLEFVVTRGKRGEGQVQSGKAAQSVSSSVSFSFCSGFRSSRSARFVIYVQLSMFVRSKLNNDF